MGPRQLSLLASTLIAFAGCGSRTGLEILAQDDAPAPAPTAGIRDAAPPEPDAQPAEGAPPGMDAAGPRKGVLPLVHLSPPLDVCPDASTTLVYLITSSATLLSYSPPSSFTTIGHIECPSTSTPNSMAVDRAGIAYVGFLDGSIFRVSAATAECRPTTFAAANFGPQFGMGFSADPGGVTDTLYLAETDPVGTGGNASSRLASVDIGTFALHIIGAFDPPVTEAELTGTGAGDLFAFYSLDANDSAILQINKATAQVMAETVLSGVMRGGDWAFAFWGGAFYTFTTPYGETGSHIHRFEPATGAVDEIAQYPEPIVGAGVSTCAPQD